jgi:superfamily II DNA or RNA helicase
MTSVTPTKAQPAHHPIALVRTRLVQSGLERLLLSPVVDVAPALLPHSRRGARLAERLGADRPALTLGSALAELTASASSSSTSSSTRGRPGGAVPGALLDRLAFALHRLIDTQGKPTTTTVAFGDAVVPGPVLPELRPLDGALVDLAQRLRPLVDDASLAQVRRRRARVTIDDGPPAGFFYAEDPGPVPPGMLLVVDDVGDGRPLQFVGVRGPLLSTASQLHAVERVLDLVREPLFDEGPRVRRLAGGRFGALLSALDELVIVDEERPRLCWRVSPDGASIRPVVRGDAPPLDAGATPRRIEDAVRSSALSTDQDRVVANLLVARDRFDGVVARALLGHPFVELADRRALRVIEARPAVDVDEGGRLTVRAAGHRVDADALGEDGAAVVVDAAQGRLLVVVVDGAERALARAVARLADAPLPPGVVADVVGRLKKSRLDVSLPVGLRGDEVPPSVALVVKAAFSPGPDGAAGGARFSLVARPLPHGPSYVPGEGPEHVFAVDDGGRAIWCARDLDDEKRRAARLFSVAGVDADDVDGPYGFSLASPERALAAAGRLAARSDVVLAVSRDGPRIQRITADALRVRWTKRTDWLGIDGDVTLPDGSRADLRALLEALRAGRRYVVLSPGNIAAVDDDVGDALALLSGFLSAEQGLARGAASVANDVATALREAGVDVDDGDAWDLVRADLDAARDATGEPPSSITATLRPYQQEGLRFLRRLVALGSGGVLADDMGLGKTLTTLCLLAERAARGPQLVVAPTSLGFNWAAECARFAGGALRPVVLHDASSVEERLRWVEGARAGDLLIASYGVIARDIVDARLSATRFATLIVDEAQAVKNASTARAQALRRLPADVRLALTGTPLENHTGELWGILDLVSPGLFGTFSQWKARWAQPIEKDDDDDRKARLARALRPFLLRRTKAAVATDLPPKVEVTKALLPSPDERAAYERLRAALVLDIESSRAGANDDEARTLSTGEQRVQILSALTRLRLCACHPAFVDDIDTGAALPPSTKQTALVELVRELSAAGHRALVFSQFVRHLRAAEHALQAAGLRTQSLTGQTPAAERRRLVQRFQSDDVDVDAFLISLKAGGFGLNLTRASYVIHLDPWWNPAVEDQASDRAHRIGQRLPVTVVRLVLRDTIEESILALHADKRALADAVLSGSDAGGTLSLDDLRALLTSTRRHVGDHVQELATMS